MIVILKSGYISKSDEENHLDSHPLLKYLHKMLIWSKKIQFMDLKGHVQNYAEQTYIYKSRVKNMLAATLQYNLDIPTLIRFLGGNFMENKETAKLL